MRLKEGIHYETARRWASNGTMPVPFTKTVTGVWMVEDTPVEQHEGKTVVCARLYGKRGAKNRAKKALEETKQTEV